MTTLSPNWGDCRRDSGNPGSATWATPRHSSPSGPYFYNRTRIFKVTLRDGVAEVLAMETMSAIAITDKVAMAMAVIPRANVKFIQAGTARIPVSAE